MENRCSVLSVAFMLLAVAGGGIAGSAPPGMPQDQLESWRPTETVALDLDQRMRDRLADLPPEIAWRGFVDAWMSANLLSADPSSAARPEAARANREALALLKSFRQGHSEEQFVALGAYLVTRFSEALAAIAEGLSQTDLGALEWLSAHNSDEAVKTIRALAGAFPEVALSSGILRPGRPVDPDRLRVARLLWLERWLIAGGLAPYPRYMTSAERALVTRWKVEDAEHLSSERRLKLLPQAAAGDPSYPVRLVSGILQYREGRLDEARTEFLRSMAEGEGRREAEAWLLLLRREQL